MSLSAFGLSVDYIVEQLLGIPGFVLFLAAFGLCALDGVRRRHVQVLRHRHLYRADPGPGPVAVKANIDHLLGHTDEQKNKAQER